MANSGPSWTAVDDAHPSCTPVPIAQFDDADGTADILTTVVSHNPSGRPVAEVWCANTKKISLFSHAVAGGCLHWVDARLKRYHPAVIVGLEIFRGYVFTSGFEGNICMWRTSHHQFRGGGGDNNCLELVTVSSGPSKLRALGATCTDKDLSVVASVPVLQVVSNTFLASAIWAGSVDGTGAPGLKGMRYAIALSVLSNSEEGGLSHGVLWDPEMGPALCLEDCGRTIQREEGGGGSSDDNHLFRLASGGGQLDDHAVRIWTFPESVVTDSSLDVHRSCAGILRGHTAPVEILQWLGGDILASADKMHTVRIWNIMEHNPVAVLPGCCSVCMVRIGNPLSSRAGMSSVSSTSNAGAHGERLPLSFVVSDPEKPTALSVWSCCPDGDSEYDTQVCSSGESTGGSCHWRKTATIEAAALPDEGKQGIEKIWAVGTKMCSVPATTTTTTDGNFFQHLDAVFASVDCEIQGEYTSRFMCWVRRCTPPPDGSTKSN